MNKRFSKLVAIVMVLIMAVQFTGLAQAATSTDTWTANGKTYAASVTTGSSSTLYVGAGGSTVHHNHGTGTSISAATRTVSYNSNYGFTGFGAGHIETAAENGGLRISISAPISFDTRTVPASYVSGNYVPRAQVQCKAGSYNVKQIAPDLITGLNSGTFSALPYSVGDAGGVYCVSIDD